MRIVAAANVEVPAYLEIARRGYQVTKKSGPAVSDAWVAHNRLHTFEGDSPIQLLGLIAIQEGRGEEWQATDKEIEAFLQSFYPQDQA